MADHNRIYRKYEAAGYLEVPGLYDKGRDNHCKVCGWENMDGPRFCARCYGSKMEDAKQGRAIRGLKVDEMSREDYVIFQAIVRNTTGDTTARAVDEYADEVKARNAQRIKDFQEKNRSQQQINAILYDR